jgi:hypothetical protein
MVGHIAGDRRSMNRATRLRAAVISCVGLSCLALLGLGGCASKKAVGKYPEMAVASIYGETPRSIAVLPFVNRTETPRLQALVRKSFYGHLSVLPYEDVELHVVDGRIRPRIGKEPWNPSKIPVKELGQLLGCDAVVFGEVTESQKVFAALYSQLSVGASIQIWDTRSGRKIWSDQKVVRYHEGGIPFHPLDLGLITVRSGLNLRDAVMIRAVDELARNLAERIPVPQRAPQSQEGGMPANPPRK